MQLNISGNISHNQKERNMAIVLCLVHFFYFLPVVFLFVCSHPFTSSSRTAVLPWNNFFLFKNMFFRVLFTLLSFFPLPYLTPFLKRKYMKSPLHCHPNIPNNITLFLWSQISSSKNFKVFLIKLNKRLLRELFKYEYNTFANK